MSITGVLIAALIVGGTGVFIGVFLGIAGKKFAVEVDEKEEAILAELPGNNCGGCGYAGCSGLAAAIAKGEAPDVYKRQDVLSVGQEITAKIVDLNEADKKISLSMKALENAEAQEETEE